MQYLKLLYKLIIKLSLILDIATLYFPERKSDDYCE